MRLRVFLALIFFAVVALAAPLSLAVPEDDCASACDDCPPACGDCPTCPPAAERVGATRVAWGATTAAVVAAPAEPLPTAPPRPLDHVPLARS